MIYTRVVGSRMPRLPWTRTGINTSLVHGGQLALRNCGQMQEVLEQATWTISPRSLLEVLYALSCTLGTYEKEKSCI